MYDTFISYRRAGGSDIAARLYDYLKLKDYNPFYDITGMEMGRFDEQLKLRLIQSENYILILSEHALDRCDADGDWLRMEIATALEYNLNIIVLKEESFVYPAELPQDIRAISMYQTIDFNRSVLSARLESLPPLLKYKKQSFSNMITGDSAKKPKISGKYITQYEDNERGRTVVRKAYAELRTFGNIVWGKTSFGTSQSWKISGKIYGKKRLAGVYRAKGYLDDGFGTFYLELKTNGILDGYWSGYDNENNQVTTGRYLFRPLVQDYKIRNAVKSDFAAITKIADSQLGKDYITEEFLREIIDEDKSTFCLVAYNTKTNKIAGFSISKAITYDEVKEISQSQNIKELSFEDKIGFVKTVAVDSVCQGLGLGTMLVDKSIDKLKKDVMDSFISTAWKHAGIINIESGLDRCGFEKIMELPNYWYESSLKEGFHCPQCGNPCHCSCVIFLKI